MTHTPATRGALVDRLLSYADKHPATWAADEAKALLREAAAALARPADEPKVGEKECACQEYEVRDCRRCFDPPYPDGKNPPPLWGTSHWQGSIPQMVGEMRNFADVADRCELTEGNAPAVIRLWADRLAATPTPPASDTAASVQQGEG